MSSALGRLDAGPGRESARTSFETRDPRRVDAYFEETYGPVFSVRVERPTVHLRVDGVHGCGYAIDEVSLEGVSMTVEPQGVLKVCRLTKGSIDWRQRRMSDRLDVGDVAMLSEPNLAHWCRWREAGVVLVTLTDELLQRVAATPLRGRAHRIGFTGNRPVSAAAAEQWNKTVALVAKTLGTKEATSSVLVTGSAGRLLAATALATFPNTTILDETPVDRTDATPETLRRALAYIEANPDLDIGVVDIARAASVTVRAVQLAFRRHLDTTPMAHLRQVRLDRAHEDLRNADPDDGTTVTKVAARWGFSSPSRFSLFYRAEYGQLPSETLRESGA